MDKRIIFEPQECDVTCTVPNCHYMHTAAWFVDGRPYHTQAEAERALAEMDRDGINGSEHDGSYRHT